jgi:D-alanine--poly(phosphoribitol) ligase subunit 2
MDKDFKPLIIRSLEALDGNIATLPEGLSGETPLFGRDGILDSVGLVSLVVAVEQAIEDECGVSVSLADEQAMSQRQSPYRTVRSLADYASRLVKTV